MDNVTELNAATLNQFEDALSHHGTDSIYGRARLSSVDEQTDVNPQLNKELVLRYKHYSTGDSNLNNYTREGRYTLALTSFNFSSFPNGWDTGNPLTNCAYLEVRRFIGTVAVHQTLYKQGVNKKWVRCLPYSGTWTAWVEDDSSVAAMAAAQQALSTANAAYQKPSSGVPKTDLASAVQTSLAAADNAIPASQKNAANGVAPLDANNKLPSANLPTAGQAVLGGVKVWLSNNGTTLNISTT